MQLLEVTHVGHRYDGESFERPVAINPAAIREVYPVGTGCSIELMPIHDGDTDYVSAYTVRESYEAVIARLRETHP